MAKGITINEKRVSSLLKERRNLVYQVAVSEKAIDFWEKQMRAVFVDMDENDENKWHPDYQDNVDSLADKIKSLVGRGRIETETIDKLEKRCVDLQGEVDNFVDDIGGLSEIKKIVKKFPKKEN